MSTHDSPIPAARRWVQGWRSTSGKVSASLVALIVVPVVAVGALLVCLIRGDGPGTRDHDDPIVIDNPEIDIYRKSQSHADPMKIGSSEEWTLRRAKAFTRIEIKKWIDDENGDIVGMNTGASAFDFYVIKGQALEKAFTVTQRVVNGENQMVVIPYARKFQKKPNENKKITPTNGGAHIGQIVFGNTTICVAVEGEPVAQPCDTTKLVKPHALTVDLCANAKCTLTKD